MSSENTPIQYVEDPLFAQKGVEVFIKRDDLLHPEVMGNKWRKLKYNLSYVKEKGLKGIVTFGGAFSNHIAATAAACYENQLSSIGIIRGDELTAESNYTLRYAFSRGMKFHFMDRITYRNLREAPETLEKKFPGYFILPEGGTNQLAIKGCQEVIEELIQTYNYVIVPVGTGGTIAGLISGLRGKGTVLGIATLKGNFLEKDVNRLRIRYGINYDNYLINNDFHFGGYGRVPDELVRFINETKEQTGLLFDPIYTGKMFFGVKNLIEASYFSPGSQLLLIHTGGLQGIRGYNEFNKKRILI